MGFSIPISQMFSGGVVWRGIVYSLLMMLGKICCGIWLVLPFTFIISCLKTHIPGLPGIRNLKTSSDHAADIHRLVRIPSWTMPDKHTLTTSVASAREIVHGLKPGNLFHKSPGSDSQDVQDQITTSSAQPASVQGAEATKTSASKSIPTREHSDESTASISLYPAAIISCAMVARGEIGFLISSVAETKGVFRSDSSAAVAGASSSEIFLVITWAIMLCTILGPLCVGLLVRRVKKLDQQSIASQVEGHKKDVLGVWGVS